MNINKQSGISYSKRHIRRKKASILNKVGTYLRTKMKEVKSLKSKSHDPSYEGTVIRKNDVEG